MPLTAKPHARSTVPSVGRARRSAETGRSIGALIGDITHLMYAEPISYSGIYKASAQDRIDLVKHGIPASWAKRIVSDLALPEALTLDALDVPKSTINRKAKTDQVLRSDEAERVLGLAKLVGQVEAMVQGVEDAEDFDAMAWTARWLSEPLPALGGAAPLDYLDTMEGQALVSSALARIQSGAYG